MRKNLVPLLVIAFAVAVLCTGVFYSLVAGKLGGDAQANAAATVVVTVRDLPRGSPVSGADVKAVEWKGARVPPGSFSSPVQVTGMRTIRALAANEPLTDAVVTSPATAGGLGVATGMRAISAQVSDSSGVLAMLKPGHHVDVQSVIMRSGSVVDTEVKTVLEDLEVLRMSATPEPSPGKHALPVVTFLATPAEADTLALADSVGRVRIALRNPLDHDKLHRAGLGVPGMIRGGSQTATAQPRPAQSRPPAPALSPATPVGSCIPPRAVN